MHGLAAVNSTIAPYFYLDTKCVFHNTLNSMRCPPNAVLQRLLRTYQRSATDLRTRTMPNTAKYHGREVFLPQDLTWALRKYLALNVLASAQNGLNQKSVEEVIPVRHPLQSSLSLDEASEITSHSTAPRAASAPTPVVEPGPSRLRLSG